MDLREARFKKRVTQWGLSKRSGVSQSLISLIENEYRLATEEEKLRLAEGLGLDVKDIRWFEP
jgi:transcriptional regulator with XRE-family HTH domain